jgi:capsule biosynthesis phosphatase
MINSCDVLIDSTTPSGKLVVDIDGTLCPIKEPEQQYEDLVPYTAMIDMLTAYKARGFRIVLQTSRNMRSYNSNIGLINKHTLPTLLAWLSKWAIPFDEIYIGKPWPGDTGFYVDDRAVRPDELLKHSHAELEAIIDAGRAALAGGGH